jgi:hypothetical protein
MSMRRIPVLLTLVLCAALPAAGQGTVGTPTVSGNTISLNVSVLGGYDADLTLSFEDVQGLSLTNLGLSVHLISLTDSTLLARLPSSVVPALPLLLRIEPPATGTLSFEGIATLELHTHDLQYTAGTPLRVFSAPLNGAFKDITEDMGAGSYRARGTTGGFSEFLIVSDTRSLDPVIALKLDKLEDLLEEYEGDMPGSVYDDLEEILEDAHAAYTGGSTNQAIQEIDDFLELVEDRSGTDIPDVWRAARDLDNVAGYLRASAMTLRFSLRLKRALGL